MFYDLGSCRNSNPADQAASQIAPYAVQRSRCFNGVVVNFELAAILRVNCPEAMEGDRFANIDPEQIANHCHFSPLARWLQAGDGIASFTILKGDSLQYAGESFFGQLCLLRSGVGHAKIILDDHSQYVIKVIRKVSYN